jgi:hypothetical protein
MHFATRSLSLGVPRHAWIAHELKRRNRLFYWTRNLALIAACSFPSLAAAHTFSLPPDSRTVTVTIPDYLEPVDTLRGAEGGVAQERTFNVLVEPVDGADAKTATEVAFNILVTHGIEIDPASIKQTSRKINGLDAVDVAFAISDGPEFASFTLVEIKAGGHFMAVLYYGSNEGMKANAAAMTSITESIQPIKK